MSLSQSSTENHFSVAWAIVYCATIIQQHSMRNIKRLPMQVVWCVKLWGNCCTRVFVRLSIRESSLKHLPSKSPRDPLIFVSAFMQHTKAIYLPSYSAKNPFPLVPPLEFLYSIHIRVSEEIRVSGILLPQNRPVQDFTRYDKIYIHIYIFQAHDDILVGHLFRNTHPSITTYTFRSNTLLCTIVVLQITYLTTEVEQKRILDTS